MEGKKGLPHLFNNGKPSEMDAKSFYNFLNWLDKNDGIIDNSNSEINEKLDGSSQFFGYDGKFFWEKFGSDKKFYSVEEIPDFWAGYRELFSDMKSALESLFKNMIESSGNVNEIKVQIEVITSAGSHSPDNYQINLIPYKKSAFKSKGCLSVIQVLWDLKSGSDSDIKEVADALKNLDYTVYAGYSIDDYEIDLSAPAMKVLEYLDRYPFEQESEKFGITLNEIEDVLDLPTRKFNQSTLKGLFSDAKKAFNDEILSQMKGKADNLSENGMFEGLAITLDNGFIFKVNSEDFKAAFLEHHQDAVNKKLNRVTEAAKKSETSSVPAELKEAFPEIEKFPAKGKLEKTDSELQDIFFQIKKDLSKTLSNVEFSWKNSDINTFDGVTGREVCIKEMIVQEPKKNKYFIWVPLDSSKDSRYYATAYFFKDKKGTFASVEDGINFPQDHLYYYVSFRKHNVANMTGDTKIQECLQGLAIDLSKSHYEQESLKKDLIEKVEKNGFSSISLSGGKVSVSDFDSEKLKNYATPAAKTGLAFIERFSEFVGPNTKVYHPSMEGPFKALLEIGADKLNGLAKDCWNPTDILVTDYDAKFIKDTFKNCKDLSEMNDLMRNLILDNKLGKAFIPLSLKLNTSDDRDSIVEPINLENKPQDYHVSTHYVNTTSVGNEIDIYAHINGKSYKFYIRCNGTTSPIIEGQHLDTEKYFKNSKFVNDKSENRDIISREDVDIESYKVNEKDNTTSFLGKSKSIIFSAMDKKDFKKQKNTVNFDMSVRHNFHQGSLPWRLVEMADKIESLPEGYGAKGNQAGHSTKKAHDVAELARDLAKLIVLMKWSTEEALIYLLTCSMKENWGAFNKFAPLYKIS